MASKITAPKKPAPRACGEIRYRVIRGPKKDDINQWYWRAERYVNNSAVTVWTGWATVLEADRQMAALVSGTQKQDVTETVGDLIRCWLAQQEQRENLSPRSLLTRTYEARALVAELDLVRVDRVDRFTIEQYRDRRLRSGKSTRTVFLELSAFQQAWRWGREVGLVPDKACPKVRIKVQIRRNTPAPERATVQAALAHLSGWAHLAVVLLEGTGCRLGELASLTWTRVFLDRAEIEVIGKTGQRSVPLSPSLVHTLRCWQAETGIAVSDRVLGKALSSVASELHRRIKAACKAAGVPRFSPQGLRRAAVSALYRSKVDVGTAAAFLGHSPQVALKYYREVSEEDRRTALESAGLGCLTEPGQVLRFRTRTKTRTTG